MKNIVLFRVRALALASIFCAASTNLQAQFITFDDTVKVVFQSVEIVNSGGETVSATQATAIVTETDSDGVITQKEQTFVQVPDGSGGTEQIVEQKTTTATPDPVTGVFEVVTIEQTKTTPTDEEGTATGSTKTETTFDIASDVDEDNLDLTPTTTLSAPDPELDTPVVFSAE